MRTSAGEWSEAPWSVTSPSYADSIVEHDGTTALCWITPISKPMLRIGDRKLSSTVKSGTCKLSATSKSLYVLLDSGVAKVPWDDDETTFTSQTINIPNATDVFTVNDKAYALVVDGPLANVTVSLYPLDGGDPVNVATNVVGLGTHVAFDRTTKRINVVSSTFDKTNHQTMKVSSHCVAPLLP